MRSEIRTPEWADTIVNLVMAHEGIEGLPRMLWLRSRRTDRRLRVVDGVRMRFRTTTGSYSSSGACGGNLIVVRMGLSQADARLTLLHELAHWITQHDHNGIMYAKYFELLWLFGEPGDILYARRRADRYQPGSAREGWGRFRALARGWERRIQYVGERLTCN